MSKEQETIDQQIGHDIWQMYDDDSQTREQVKGKAALLECDVVFAGPKTVQLDLDSEEAFSNFQHIWPFLTSKLGEFFTVDYTVTKSRGGNYHVTFDFIFEPSPLERLLVQAILGSDPKREILNYMRWKQLGDDMSCFFVPKPKLLTEGVKDETSHS